MPQVNGHVGYRYYLAQHTSGHIVGYEMSLHSESITAARADVLSDFPADSKVVWFNVKESCAQLEVQSPTLGTALSDKAIGDADGMAIIEFGTAHSNGTTGYTPGAINDAIVGLGSYATPQDAPAC